MKSYPFIHVDAELRNAVEADVIVGAVLIATGLVDRAIDFAIDVITGCQDAHGHRRFPNRIEHASITRPDQLARLAAAVREVHERRPVPSAHEAT